MGIEELQEGDVVEFFSKVPDSRWILPGTEVPLVKHYGIIVVENGQKKMAHNTFQQYPRIDDIEKTLNGRSINRVIRTGLKSDEIIARHREVENIKYDWLKFNCEDYVFKLTGVRVGLDQRIQLVIAIALIIVAIIAIRKIFFGK